VPVLEIIRHPDYNRRYWDSDLALLRLGQHVIMDNVTRPICLPPPNKRVKIFLWFWMGSSYLALTNLAKFVN